ncbi:MAG: hypothetical protein FWE40_04025 [Oscillospiraceae bacterium]|nr:hypothetical protein [Oscillospiraceae bacterium]
MRKIFALVLALLVLAACAAPVVDEPTTETTEEVTTTQPAYTLAPFDIAVEVDEDDPFSFVLRAYAEFAQWHRENRAVLLEQGDTLAALEQWQHPLMEHFTMRPEWGFSDVQGRASQLLFEMRMEYALHDISGNGVEDLIIRFSEGDILVDIYSLVNGVPVQQLRTSGIMRIYPSGVVITRDGRGTHSWADFYRFVDGQLRLSTRVSAQERFGENYESYTLFFRVTGEWQDATFIPISEQEYNRVYAQYGAEPRQASSLEHLNWRPLFVPA